MHIKQIIIRGFKTYNEEVSIGPLSPNDNVFVGLNGHGKSNFFSAIMFVLSDKFSHIRQEEKQRLIYEGSGGEQVNHASVEIILDNADGRLPIERPNISLKRVLRGNKDDFFIDGKHVTKNDINSLLESGGFSRSNPYYVVQQGRVASLAAMNESQCLELLKEVVGTRVYDERKKESEKLLEETKRKRDNIQEVMERIKDRMDELESESEELRTYQELEKTRRALEYLLYKNHVVESQEQLENIDAKRTDLVEKLHRLKISKNNLQEEHETVVSQLQSQQVQVQQANASLGRVEEEYNRLNGIKNQLIVQLQGMFESDEYFQSQRFSMQQELEEVKYELEEELLNIEDLKPQYKEIYGQEIGIRKDIAQKKQRQEFLYEKQGSLTRFQTMEQRQEYLQSEQVALQELIRENQGIMQQYRETVPMNQEKDVMIQGQIKAITGEAQDLSQNLEEIMEKILHIKQKRTTLQQNLTNLKDSEEYQKAELNAVSTKITNARYKLASVLPGTLAATIERLQEACAGLPGYYGPVIELIQPKHDNFYTCIDVVAKLKLFYLVVDGFITAKKVLDINKQIAGDQIQIIPLDWLKEQPRQNRIYPQGNDSLVLSNQIQTSAASPIDMTPVIEHLFGKSLLVRSYDVGNRYAREYQLNCVTADGQIVYAGAFLMKAGFHDRQKERLRSYYNLRDLKAQQIIISGKLTEIKNQRENALSQDLELINDQQQVVLEKFKINNRLQELQQTRFRLEKEQLDARRRIEVCNSEIERLEVENQHLNSSMADIQNSISIQHLGELSQSEKNELNTLTQQIHKLESEIVSCSNQRLIIEHDLKQATLRAENLLPERLHRINQALRDLEISSASKSKTEIEQDIGQIDQLISQAETTINQASLRVKDVETGLRRFQEQERRVANQEQEITQEFDEMRVMAERLESKRQQVLDKKEDYIKKMGNLGSLPADAHEKYKSEKSSSLMRLLERNSKELSKFVHVNKRSLEQYTRFQERLEALTKRLNDLESSDTAIQKLLGHLENVKDEAIVKTFRTVAHHFTEVFNELVPQGRGRLKMIKGEGEGVAKYVGVNISVSFSRTEEVVQRMQALSGGQKTAVAIALIIAIQRADPAPFYLFDELDAALDSQFRSSLASLIQRGADKAQFIMTTFKPELCKSSSKMFEVFFTNGASHIREVNTERALDVISQFDAEARQQLQDVIVNGGLQDM